MYTVKEVYKREYAHKIGNIGIGTGNGWAVVDADEVPVYHRNPYTGKCGFSVFNLKGTAQKEADWMNKNVDKIESLPVERMQ